MPYDGTSLNATDLQVANYTRLQYPNPFFDLSRHYFPKSVKTLFKYCRIFFYQNEFIHNVINKLAEYPITDFIYDGVNDETVKQNYKELAEHHLKLKSFLIECGLDYFTFGNCIVSANMKFKRFLVCKNCNQPTLYEEFPFRWVNMKFMGEKCPKCGVQGVEAEIDDRYLKNPKYFKFIKWSPENITIDYDELTGESRYFYQMNEKTRKGIVEGKKDVLQRVPKIFIEAIQKNRKIELDQRNLYHFKRPTLAEEDQGWGKPLLLPAMKMLWYMQTLRRGNEAIVADHLIPMRSVYPSSQGNLDPFTQLNLGQWTANVQEQVLKWRRDPNHLGVFPVPIGYQSLGGDAKMLMLTPELQYLEESIINSLGVPVEFIKGGSTWTSSSVSLRIVENHFLTYRESITEFLNYFVVPKVKYFLGYPDVKIRLKKFKMSDDIQAKELMLQLVAQGKIPDSYVLEEFGIDPVEARDVFKADHKTQIDMQTQQLMAQAEAQGKGMVTQARYQTRAQAEATEEAARLNERKFAAELVKEMQITDQDPSDVLQKQAIALQFMDPKRQQLVLMGLQKQAPVSFGFIMQRLQLSGAIPSPEEQRQQQMMEEEQAMKEKEHEMKIEQEKVKMKHESHKVEVSKQQLEADKARDAHKFEAGKKQIELDKKKVEVEKERAKIPEKKSEKK